MNIGNITFGPRTGIDINEIVRAAGPSRVWPWPVREPRNSVVTDAAFSDVDSCPSTRERLERLEQEYEALRQYVTSLEERLAAVYQER